ncbi:MAG: Eco57I restriction-modification methylase domain-containing protein [Deltaproteobacteria bacterium]|jgi:hypothetical protein|nr:Eco57I restriction-modification methylase domain-containing protein [Deltaproteobacteria bacterium]
MKTAPESSRLFRTLLEGLETKRLIVQREFEAQKTIEERRKLGQFSTPPELAREIVSFALKNFDLENKIRFFDPAFGTGVFYSALLALTKPENITLATALEIDPVLAKAAANLWHDFNITIVKADFTQSDPIDKYNLIICNPPYVRHHLIDPDQKNLIRQRTKLISGINFSGLAFLYCHFLSQSIQWMDEGALAGWLIPSEFMEVNYGKALKEFLLTKTDLFRIHRFDMAKLQFKDALVTSALVWFRKSPLKSKSLEFSFGNSLNFPSVIIKINKVDLLNQDKWNHLSDSQSPKNEKNLSAPKLKDYFQVKRGIATGANDFFILEETRIHQLGLPLEFFRPILPSLRFLKTLEIEADEFGHTILPKPLFLLDCHLNEDEIKKNYPTLFRYLESGRLKVANRYLCRSRKCWYFQEQRQVPLFVCSYMGRPTNKNKSAFRFILNNSKAIVSNSYLALYPNKNLAQSLERKPELKSFILASLNDLPLENIQKLGRVYGGGLNKIEPRELLNLSLPFLKNIDS